MANRFDWFYYQTVQEDELDASQDALETADLNQAIDFGLSATDVSQTEGGIMKGLVATDGGGLVSSISAGAAYDNSGRRVVLASSKSLNLTNAGDTTTGTGGTADGAIITPSAGDHRWVSVFVTFDRSLSDLREDGNSQEVYHSRAESFYFTLVAGTAATKPTEPTNLPALQSGKLLLADIKIDDTSVESVNEDRRQVWLRADSALTAPVTRGGTGYPKRGIQTSYSSSSITTPVKEAILQVLGYYNDHVRNDGSASDKHDATVIILDPASFHLVTETDVQGGIAELDNYVNTIFVGDNTFSGDNVFTGDNVFAGEVSFEATVEFKAIALFEDRLVAEECTIYSDDAPIDFIGTEAVQNPANTAGYTNQLIAKNLPKAWATIVGGTELNIVDGFNIDAIAHEVTVALQLGFADDMADAYYAVLATPLSTAHSVRITNRTTGTFDLYAYDVDGATVDLNSIAGQFAVLVFGEQAITVSSF